LEAASGDLLRGICKFDRADFEVFEERPDLGHVVQREDELGLQFAQPFRHLAKLVRLQVVAIELDFVVWRVEIEKRRGPVVAGEHFFVRQAFDLNPCQTVVRFFDERRNAFRIESGRRVYT